MGGDTYRPGCIMSAGQSWGVTANRFLLGGTWINDIAHLGYVVGMKVLHELDDAPPDEEQEQALGLRAIEYDVAGGAAPWNRDDHSNLADQSEYS